MLSMVKCRPFLYDSQAGQSKIKKETTKYEKKQVHLDKYITEKKKNRQ